jgi:uncharacterized protein
LKLHLTGATGLNMFTAYGEGYVAVNNRRIGRSVIVLPDRLIEDWPASTFAALTAEHLSVLAGLGREIILIGTGRTLRFAPPAVTRSLVEAGVGFEFMDIQAACRTYNILVSEERKVAAALLFD